MDSVLPSGGRSCGFESRLGYLTFSFFGVSYFFFFCTRASSFFSSTIATRSTVLFLYMTPALPFPQLLCEIPVSPAVSEFTLLSCNLETALALAPPTRLLSSVFPVFVRRSPSRSLSLFLALLKQSQVDVDIFCSEHEYKPPVEGKTSRTTSEEERMAMVARRALLHMAACMRATEAELSIHKKLARAFETEDVTVEDISGA